MIYRILCCDGGGIRGLVTALLIQNLEKTCKGFLQSADGFAGTSTGGLISLGLTKGESIDRIVEIYRNDGKEIFTPNGKSLAEADIGEPSDWDQRSEELPSLPDYRKCYYKSDGLKKLALGLLGKDRLSDSKKMIAVTSAQLWDAGSQSWQPRALSNVTGNPFNNVPMVEAALATAAAPTYFPPHEVSAELGYFADGGLFANNPAMVAVGEALRSGVALTDLRVLSLGTGTAPQGIRPDNFKKRKPLDWGVSSWIWPIEWGDKVPPTALISLMFDGTADTATTQATQLMGKAFCRGNVPLAEPYPLDDYENVAKLEAWTNEYIATPEWQAVVKWVQANWC